MFNVINFVYAFLLTLTITTPATVNNNVKQEYVKQAPIEIKKEIPPVDTLSDCQYSDRLVDGNCDNTDPACPETIKDPVLKGGCSE